jgi:hypothetical protein
MADFADVWSCARQSLKHGSFEPRDDKPHQTKRNRSKGVEQFLMFLGWDVLKIFEVAFESFGRRMPMVFLTCLCHSFLASI